MIVKEDETVIMPLFFLNKTPVFWLNMFKNAFLILIVFFLYVSCSKNIRRIATVEPIIRVKFNNQILKVPLEQYVSQVLAGEVSKNWPHEALKAQAIAARTFALKRMKEKIDASFHVSSTVLDQVFHHKSFEPFIKATNDTRGLVAILGQEIAETSFHSTCGGHTADAKAVWGTKHEHLQGISCPYCKNSPTFQWQAQVSRKKLFDIFKEPIKSIKLLERGPDGRVGKIMLNNKKSMIISAHKFRMKLGHMIIKSTNISKVSFEKDMAIFLGYGFGHGVGMCQYGAMAMAKEGHSAQEIISYYYPGTKIKRAY